MRESRDRYLKYFDSTVREIPQGQPGQAVFVARPLASYQTAADRLTAEVRSKLTSETIGPYRVLSSNSHTVTIDETGVANTVSTDRVMVAPTKPDLVMADATS